MKKIEISQDELDQGNGRFHDYMNYVERRLASKSFEPAMALFHIVDIVKGDGYVIELGSVSDEAGMNVAKWVDDFYAERSHISYYFPPVAYQINGAVYLLRMPVDRVDKIMLIQAVIDLTQLAANQINSRQLERLESDYNEFYDCYYGISKLDTTIVANLESAAQKIYNGSAHFALSKWESLHFVEKAMKEVLAPLGVKLTGANGHDVRGALHDEWVRLGFQPLPIQLLEDVMCSASIRYEKTPQSLTSTLNAHHSAIRLGALIAEQIPSIPKMQQELSMKVGEFSRDAVLSIARIVFAVDPLAGNWQKVKLLR